jgi:CBS domain containing-hemolysin-like protein
VVLLLLSAFFSASETALSAHNRIRLKKKAEDGDRRAKTALKLTESFDKTATAIMVGNNLANIAASAIATVICTGLFARYGAGIAVAVTTALVLAFGEILPKSFAAANADRLALFLAGPLRLACAVLTPFSAVFGRLRGAFRGAGGAGEKAPTITEEELLYFIETIEEEGVLEEQESDLVQSALEFDETTLREIITPRVNIDALDISSTQEEIAGFLLNTSHSRIPVFESSVDNITGVLFVRDAMKYLARGEDVPLRELLEEARCVHKGMKLSALLTVFKSEQVRMVIVLDEYGGTFGIVTLVDLLEELVGDLYREEEPEELIRLEDGVCEVTGGYPLWDMFEELDPGLEKPGSDYATASGWAMNLLGQIPGVGESFEAGGYRFTALSVEGHKIARLRIERSAPAPGARSETALKGADSSE